MYTKWNLNEFSLFEPVVVHLLFFNISCLVLNLDLLNECSKSL